MKWMIALSTLAIMGLALVCSAPAKQGSPVEIVRLTAENWSDYAPAGKEVDAIAGDYVLRNGHLTAVIAQPLDSRNANMTVKEIAGALIDLTTREQASDQLSAFYPGQRKFPYRAWKAVDAAGQEISLASRPVSSHEAAAVVVTAEAADGRPRVEVTYALKSDQPFLDVATKFTNTGDKPLAVPLVDDLRIDGGKENMGKSPNGTSPLFWVHDRFWKQAYGLEAPGRELEMNSDARVSTVKYQADGKTEVLLAPGQGYTLNRRIFAGPDLLAVRAAAGQLRGEESQPAQVTVTGSNGPVADAEVTFSQNGVARGSAMTDAAGRLATRLPAGVYNVAVHALGAEISLPGALTVEVAKGQNDFQFTFDYKPGKLQARITDANGGDIPCKVQFLAQADAPQPDFGPETAEFGVRNVRYAPLGKFEQLLPAGKYEVIISHGPEFDAIFQPLTVAPGETVELRGQLVRSVKTAGWISTDFHSHSSPSGDNTSSQLGRVLNLVTEHIEFAPCTEHNRIDTYEPHVEKLRIGKFFGTVSGIELTGSPLPLNHQNAFPMVYKPHTQDNGAPVPDADPQTQIERLALWDDRSDKLVQVNHPDIGWMFYDKDGNGEPDGGYSGMLPHIKVMEIHPVENALELGPVATRGNRKTHNTVFNWLQLLNQGLRIPGVVNTDAHYNFHGSGGLRNWVQSPTDDPAAVRPLDVVHAAEQGRSVMSNGPFLEVSATEAGKMPAATAGEDLRAPSGKVELRIRVQCPNWCDVDRVFVLLNGRQAEQFDFRRETDSAKFRKEGPVKFDEQVTLDLSADTHLVVVAGGEKLKLGPVVGPGLKDVQPAALANPIYVDVDGGGFKANRDTLGVPLPVKFVAPKP
jgi:hypothetical protein